MIHAVALFTERVTYVSRYGFQWFSYGKNSKQNLVENNMSPVIMTF
jgi:hypothetical protein